MSKKMLQKGYSKIVENYNRKRKSGKCLQKDRKTYIHINGKGESVLYMAKHKLGKTFGKCHELKI